MRYRSKIFLAAVATAAITAIVATSLMTWSSGRQMRARIERDLVTEARLVAELVERHAIPADRLQQEVHRLALIVDARLTLIDPAGRVLADSGVDAEGLERLENHSDRPEVVEARRTGLGTSSRFSSTVAAEMLYVALPTRHESVDVVRIARPLTDVDAQLGTIRHLSLLAVAAGLLAALGLSWSMSAWLGRRVGAIAAAARRYSAGDLSQPIRDHGADEIGLVARALDGSVQEIGRRLEELARDRARMSAILSGMIEGVVVVDDHGRLQLANDAACRMLALDAPPPVGPHYLELIRQPDVVAILTKALQGQAAAAELPLPYGADRILVGRSAPVTAAGGGAVLVLHDVTDLRRADQIRRDFVANVSHELRTPLTAVRGYAEALLDGPADPAAAQRFHEIIVRHAHRMERLVDDLLRLARLDAGQEPIEPAGCRVEDLVADVRLELAAELTARRQSLETAIDPDAATIVADPAKLQDVLRNLVENASRYAPEDTTIRISVGPAGDRILLAVADEGPGIPEADLTRVFERFYRVDKAREREKGGTGLGLAIVKHLVGLHGGTVQAANRPEGGAVFTIWLPHVSPVTHQPSASS